MTAMGGIPDTIDPTITVTGKMIAGRHCQLIPVIDAGRTPRFPEKPDRRGRHPKVELPAVFFVHQLRGVVNVIQSQDVRQFVHDDGPDEWGTARPGQCVCEVRCVKSHLAGDVNIGFARNLDRPMGNRMITRSVRSGHDGR